MTRLLVTGGAGFIGGHLVDSLLQDGVEVDVIDNFDPMYPSDVKQATVRKHMQFPGYRFLPVDITDLDALRANLSGKYDAIVHLAAKAGVRQSIQHPISYVRTNILGTQNLLELARTWGVRQFVFASSSSVYGVNPHVPWREGEPLEPISPYACTKLSSEGMGRVYTSLYGTRFIALRFFSVIGSRQRPDLVIHKFTRLIMDGEKIPIYGDGQSRRDYTHVSDVVKGIRSAVDYTGSQCEIINIGNNHTISLMEMVHSLEALLDKKASICWLEEQKGDVPQTWADISKAQRLLRYQPGTGFREGLEEFLSWFLRGPGAGSGSGGLANG